MFTKRMVPGMFALTCFTLSGPAAAGYFGIGAAQNTVGNWDSSTFQDGSVSNVSADDSDVGFRIFGGGSFNENFGAEIGYSNFGEATWKGDSDGSGFLWPAGPVSVKVGLSGFDISLLGKLPVSESFALIAKVGVLKWKADFDVGTSVGSGSDSDDDDDTFFGLGAELKAGGSVSLRAEYTSYTVEDEDLDSLSLSLVFRGGN